ncbi:hypothetical protein FXO38_01723 [Capsicum annuum]|uniref:Uncharacterized protein n=1 Tax=Capsicum annuum TaxID=4072 RepID=A0A2G2YWI1_CAPAN|nr:hypothetical protein FXO37_17192 [Capsicum annuum]KAF3681406.1 hypothetical protein FXO38_01723 [Capsicum annuum]PHT74102.1 hypothetical protein T459_21379 [Capsicum annuum]
MTLATAKEAEELKKTKTLDQQEQLCELSRAIVVLSLAFVDEMLHKLEKEIDDYDATIGDRLRLLDRDIAAVGIDENGIASVVHGSSNMHQPEDGLEDEQTDLEVELMSKYLN